MKNNGIPIVAFLLLVVAMLACGSTTPRELVLYPSETPNASQTPILVQITTTPLPTQTSIVVLVTKTATTLCVVANEAVYLRPSASDNNYPILPLSNGSRLTDLGG